MQHKNNHNKSSFFANHQNVWIFFLHIKYKILCVIWKIAIIYLFFFDIDSQPCHQCVIVSTFYSKKITKKKKNAACWHSKNPANIQLYNITVFFFLLFDQLSQNCNVQTHKFFSFFSAEINTALFFFLHLFYNDFFLFSSQHHVFNHLLNFSLPKFYFYNNKKINQSLRLFSVQELFFFGK